LIRPSLNKEDYDNKKTRAICKRIAKGVVRQIKDFRKGGYKIMGIFGMEGSPTCGAVVTHIRPQGDILSGKKGLSVRGEGVFIEELKKELKRNHLKVPFFDWDIQAKKFLL